MTATCCRRRPPACADLLDDEEGLDKALSLIEAALPAKLRETAYALACDIAAADQEVYGRRDRGCWR